MKKIILLSTIILSFTRLAYSQTNSFEMSKNIDIYISLLNELNVNYADEIYPSELVKNSIDGMLEKLDPYTVYITESEIEDFKFLTTGEYGGIGSLVLERDGSVYISQVYDETPSQRAGLRAGDRIIRVDGKVVTVKNSSQVSEMMKGQPGTICKIGVERIGHKGIIEIDIKRELIKLDNVSYYGMLSGDIGYVRLDRFATDAAKEVLNAFVLLKENNKLNGFILDLRGNGGGLLNEAVDICNIFIPRGKKIVSIKGKQTDRNQTYYTTKETIDVVIPLIILVDEYSASASEIVAGAVQDLDRGVVVGTKTFGKGLVQNIVPLPFNSQLKITTAKYYIPSGRCIQEVDYFKHDEDGDIKITDSSSLKYKTMNGRTVYGGGGITPDVLTTLNMGDEFTAFLVMNFYLFDYAIKYANTSGASVQLEDFAITDDIFNDFMKYLVDERKISFKSESQILFDEFCKNAKEANDYQRLEPYINEMNTALNIPITEYFERDKEDIKRALYVSIITSMYSNKESYGKLASNDEEIQRALELISDRNKMTKLLKK